MPGTIIAIIFFIIIAAACCASSNDTSNTRNNTAPKRSPPSNRTSYRSYSECPSCGAPYYDGYCDECGYPDVNQGWLGEEYGWD